MPINVPRVIEITGKQTQEELAAALEWQRKRKLFQNDTARYGFGTPESKAAWKRRIERTRTR